MYRFSFLKLKIVTTNVCSNYQNQTSVYMCVCTCAFVCMDILAYIHVYGGLKLTSGVLLSWNLNGC